MNPKVSVIIVSYNNETWVHQCLESLLVQTYENIEVIWIDNCSKDKTVEYVYDEKFKPLNIIFKKLDYNTGFAIGNNEGYKLATGDIIFLLNTDARIGKKTIAQAVEFMVANPHVGIVQNTLMQMKNPEKIDSVGSMFTNTGFLHHLEEEIKTSDISYPIFAGKAASIFISRKLLEKTNLFNDKFGSYFEDTDLCIRSWLVGFDVVYLKTEPTLHNGGATGLFLQSGRTDFYSFRNRLFCLFAYLKPKDLVKVLPAHIFVIVLVLIAYLSKGEFAKFWAIIKALWWILANTRYVYRFRAEFKNKIVGYENTFSDKLTKKLDIVYGFKSLIGYTGRNAKTK